MAVRKNRIADGLVLVVGKGEQDMEETSAGTCHRLSGRPLDGNEPVIICRGVTKSWHWNHTILYRMDRCFYFGSRKLSSLAVH